MVTRIAGAVALAAAAVALSPQAWAIRAGCTPMDRIDAREDAQRLQVAAAHLDGLHEVHARISRVAGIRPELHVCRSAAVNAMAVVKGGRQYILVDTGLIKLIDGDADEMAAVVGHEFGHLLMRHRDKKMSVARETLVNAAQEARRMVSRGVDEQSAVREAVTRFAADNAEFSRTAEREADDAGFQLLKRAGYKAAGARKLSEKMIKAGGALNGGYFATHPGWGERAACYRAFHAWLTKQPAERISASLEESVAYFDGDGLSRLSQEYQSEAGVATLALCVSLYREGRKVETLHCLEKLQDRELVESFRKITGWSDFILMPRPSRIRGNNLFASRTPDGTVVMTNCRYLAEEQGSRQVKPWAGARMRSAAATAPAPEGTTTMICAPDLCDCERVDINEALPGLKRFGER